MSGGGTYYDRDVSDRSTRTSRGTTSSSERIIEESVGLNKALLGVGRRLVTEAKSPIGYGFDITGSMEDLPLMMWDRWPNVIKELIIREYLKSTELSISMVGDIFSDTYPIQICDFSSLRNLDAWFKQICWLQRNGGGQKKESYELFAWFYANRVEMPNAENPFFLFTGDEGFYPDIKGSDLRKHFGGEASNTTGEEAFAALLKKFNNNVFLLHRAYRGIGSPEDNRIVRQWESVLGSMRVIKMRSDAAIADLTLGIFALASGSRTLEGYCEDMATRTDVNTGKPDPQSPKRIAEVKDILEEFAGYIAETNATRKPVKNAKKACKKDEKENGTEKEIIWL
jgi:hypothetical protein